MDSEDWLAIIGIGTKTRVRAEVALDSKGKPRFAITEEFRLNEGGDTGDATVPLMGALPPFLRPEYAVAVSPDDFGFWEARDRVLAIQVGFHAMLPNLNLVQRLVLKHLRGGRYRGQVTGRPVPGVADADWRPPITDLSRR